MADYPDTADGHRQRLKDQEKAGKSTAPPAPKETKKEEPVAKETPPKKK